MGVLFLLFTIHLNLHKYSSILHKLLQEDILSHSSIHVLVQDSVANTVTLIVRVKQFRCHMSQTGNVAIWLHMF